MLPYRKIGFQVGEVFLHSLANVKYMLTQFGSKSNNQFYKFVIKIRWAMMAKKVVNKARPRVKTYLRIIINNIKVYVSFRYGKEFAPKQVYTVVTFLC